MKVLIFGGTRFMGKYVTETLLTAGFDVTVANRGTREQLPGVTHILCDRSDISNLDKLKDKNFDYVVDFSAYDSNWVEQAASIFKNQIKRYIFISSGAVYKPSNVFPIQEHFKCEAAGLHYEYSAQKIRSEQLLVSYHEQAYFETVSCRLPFVLGAHNYEDREAFVLSRLLANRPIVVPDGGTAVHSFIFAGDVALAILKLIKAPSYVSGEAFNIAISQGVTTQGFIAACAEVAGKSPLLYPLNLDKAGLLSDRFDLKNLLFPFPQTNGYLDNTKMLKYLNFAPTHSLPEMIEQFYQWWLVNSDLTPINYELEAKALAVLGLDN
jgi:nucleoside-diphosphate-sugar epimerase